MSLDIEFFAADAYHKLSMVKSSIDKLEKAIRAWACRNKLNRKVMVVGSDGIAAGLADSIRRSVNVEVDYAASAEEALDTWKISRHAVVVASVTSTEDADVFQLLSDIGRGPRAIVYVDNQISEATRNAARIADAKIMKISAEAAMMTGIKDLLDDAVPTEH